MVWGEFGPDPVVAWGRVPLLKICRAWGNFQMSVILSASKSNIYMQLVLCCFVFSS